MIILSDAGASPCKNARRIRSRLRSMSDHSECSSRIRFFASSRVKRPISNVSSRRDVQHTIRRRWHACGFHSKALPRRRNFGVTLFLSRQPEESCGTLVRDRIRCGLDRFSYADAAASLFS